MRSRAALALALLASAPAAAQEPPLRLPGIQASRVVLEARIVDRSGRPIPDLTPGDLRLEVDGRAVVIERLVFVSEDASRDNGSHPRTDLQEAVEPASREPSADLAALAPATRSGRLVVLLFQKDFASSRLRGLVKSISQAEELVAPFGSDDRVAIVSFDSRLRLHLDFTGDSAAVRQALRESALLRWPPPLEPQPPPSLAAGIRELDARRASTPERALFLLGEALQEVPGAKTILLFGWGLGELVGGVVRPRTDYGPARRALEAARATVYCLDVTEASWHSLEVGLQELAEDTGGEYFRMFESPGAAVRRVAGALSGHYLIGFEPPAGKRGEHRVELRLVKRGGTVLTRRRYVD